MNQRRTGSARLSVEQWQCDKTVDCDGNWFHGSFNVVHRIGLQIHLCPLRLSFLRTRTESVVEVAMILASRVSCQMLCIYGYCPPTRSRRTQDNTTQVFYCIVSNSVTLAVTKTPCLCYSVVVAYTWWLYLKS